MTRELTRKESNQRCDEILGHGQIHISVLENPAGWWNISRQQYPYDSYLVGWRDTKQGAMAYAKDKVTELYLAGEDVFLYIKVFLLTEREGEYYDPESSG